MRMMEASLWDLFFFSNLCCSRPSSHADPRSQPTVTARKSLQAFQTLPSVTHCHDVVQVMLVAVHPWDCNGAKCAGMQAPNVDRTAQQELAAPFTANARQHTALKGVQMARPISVNAGWSQHAISTSELQRLPGPFQVQEAK